MYEHNLITSKQLKHFNNLAFKYCNVLHIFIYVGINTDK
jgi:hypothetical protein